MGLKAVPAVFCVLAVLGWFLACPPGLQAGILPTPTASVSAKRTPAPRHGVKKKKAKKKKRWVAGPQVPQEEVTDQTEVSEQPGKTRRRHHKHL
jgi:hypothetical protein